MKAYIPLEYSVKVLTNVDITTKELTAENSEVKNKLHTI